MLRKIKFDSSGISNTIEFGSPLGEGGEDVYDVDISPTGLYKKEGSTVRALTQDEYDDRFLDYKGKRKKEYPSLEDQLDEIWKILDDLGSVTSEVLDNIKAVKVKHPK